VSEARFHPEARAEFREAAQFYESRLAGLGVAFTQEIERVVGFIAARPTAGAAIGEHLRRMIARRCPYWVVYRVSGNDLEIIAVAHHRRRPDYWRART